MRKIRIIEHVSLDGIISPGARGEYRDDFAHGGWTAPYRTPAGAAMLMEAQGERYDLLLGRRTYDLWSGFWPTVANNPMADRLNAATKYVATHRPESCAWGPIGSLGDDVMAGIRALKATAGPDLLVCGSGTLLTPLIAAGLVDELVLLTYPVLLGRGIRLLADTVDPREFAFVSTKATPTGVMLTTYRHVGALVT